VNQATFNPASTVTERFEQELLLFPVLDARRPQGFSAASNPGSTGR
jgi:hypothetical protein